MADRIDYKEKFIGVVDIVGFSNFTQRANVSAEEVNAALACLGSKEERLNNLTCPEAPSLSRDLDFAVTVQFDTAVISAEISPAGAINVLAHCWIAGLKLMGRGLMCRGYVARGKIFHGERVYGPGHSDAAAKEKNVSFFKRDAAERGTPFVEVDSQVVDYVLAQADQCALKMFPQFVERDGPLAAIFPFRALSMQGSVIDGSPESVERALENNARIIQNLMKLKDRVRSYIDPQNPSAVSKGEHYLRILDRQQANFEQNREFISNLRNPFGPRATPDLLPGLFREDE